MWAGNAPEWVVLEYATALAGAILTPINPAVTDAELLALVTQSQPTLLYAATEFRGSSPLDRARDVTSNLAIEIRPLEEAFAPESLTVEHPLPDVEAQAPFLLQYTSGTTGRPKGALLSHSAAYNAARFSAERLGLTADDVWLCPLPLHHVGGSVCILLPMLSVGGAVALAGGWDVEQVVQLVAASRSTVIGAVPTMMIDLAGHPGAADGRLASLRILQGGGSTVAPALISRIESVLGVCVVVAYGQSEAPVTISCRPDDSAEDKALTIGSPVAAPRGPDRRSGDRRHPRSGSGGRAADPFPTVDDRLLARSRTPRPPRSTGTVGCTAETCAPSTNAACSVSTVAIVI